MDQNPTLPVREVACQMLAHQQNSASVHKKIVLWATRHRHARSISATCGRSMPVGLWQQPCRRMTSPVRPCPKEAGFGHCLARQQEGEDPPEGCPAVIRRWPRPIVPKSDTAVDLERGARSCRQVRQAARRGGPAGAVFLPRGPVKGSRSGRFLRQRVEGPDPGPERRVGCRYRGRWHP